MGALGNHFGCPEPPIISEKSSLPRSLLGIRDRYRPKVPCDQHKTKIPNQPIGMSDKKSERSDYSFAGG
ncbi:MAG TPA: hypothetical protein DDW52_18065 [Planctomycetaceae bacterium]|nr:hypothetical protein [Planctomycetaceae bacterium]